MVSITFSLINTKPARRQNGRSTRPEIEYRIWVLLCSSRFSGVFHAPVSGLYLLSIYAVTADNAGRLYVEEK